MPTTNSFQIESFLTRVRKQKKNYRKRGKVYILVYGPVEILSQL